MNNLESDNERSGIALKASHEMEALLILLGRESERQDSDFGNLCHGLTARMKTLTSVIMSAVDDPNESIQELKERFKA